MCEYKVLFPIKEINSVNGRNALEEEALSKAMVYKWFSRLDRDVHRLP